MIVGIFVVVPLFNGDRERGATLGENVVLVLVFVSLGRNVGTCMLGLEVGCKVALGANPGGQLEGLVARSTTGSYKNRPSTQVVISFHDNRSSALSHVLRTVKLLFSSNS